MSRDTKCCDFTTLLKMKHEVLPVISNIFYMLYLRELKSRYSGVHYSRLTRWEYARSWTGTFAMSNNMWKNDENCARIISYILHMIIKRIKI